MSVHNKGVLPLQNHTVFWRMILLLAVIIPCALYLAVSSQAFSTSISDFNVSGGSVEGSASGTWQIKLNRTSFTADGGQTRQLEATVTLDSGSSATVTTPPAVDWSSSDDSIATVDKNGKVTTASPGKATITCALSSDAKVAATCEVTVISTRYIAKNYEAVQTEHPYAENTRDCWQYTHPLASELIVEFDERTAVEDGFDFIEVSDADGKVIERFTGKELASGEVWVQDGTVSVRLVSDGSNNDWGFAVVQVTPIIYDGWYELDGKIYFYRDNEIQKGIVNDGGAYYYFDEETGEYVGPYVFPEPEPEPEPIHVISPEDPESSVPIGPEGGGPAVYKMPYLLGKFYTDAEDELIALGATNIIENWVFDDFFKTAWGTVTTQNPNAGMDFAVTEPLTLEISLGPSSVMIPDVTGMPVSDAVATLSGAGFLYHFEAGMPTNIASLFNTVYSTDPYGGSYASPGTNVAISLYIDADAKG